MRNVVQKKKRCAKILHTLQTHFAHYAKFLHTQHRAKKKNVVRKPKDTLPSLCVTALTQRLQVTSIMQSYMEEVLPIISNYSMVI